MYYLLGLVLVGVYGWGVWALWRGFSQTNFSPSLVNKLFLSSLWPVLLLNNSYRQNFGRALKGR